MSQSHAQLIDKYAELTIKAGLNLQAGQQLLITAPIEAVDLVRRVTHHAYQAGATLVTTLFNDEQAALMRYQLGQDASFDAAPGWLFNGMAEAFRDGKCARLAIIGEDPALLSGQDPEKLSRANRARSRAYKPVIELITTFTTNWCIISAATPSHARNVFPGLPEEQAMAALWQAIFKCTRADQPDPVAAWAAHSAALHARVKRMNEKRYAALKYKGPGTDFTLGLVDDHVWAGGGSVSRNGILCNPNIPTEEVFSMPHRERVDGVVRSTKPLSYQGSLIDGIEVTFEKGRIVKGTAAKGADVFRKMIETDDGAARLGEVALVPHSSPISASGIVFNETLYDENAASHIAVGQAYAQNMAGTAEMSAEEKLAKGMNTSLVHVDWMIGSGELNVDGVFKDGKTEPLMRKGEWVD
ncbi:MAG: aminopeptidase [Alphaproteobacteria bacterium]|nr:aminopeptidase [Alphaproteobacteria bacterium]